MNWTLFLFGVMGVILHVLFKLQNAHKIKNYHWLTFIELHWLGTLTSFIAMAILVYVFRNPILYMGVDITPLLAVTFGYAGDSMIKKLFSMLQEVWGLILAKIRGIFNK